MYDTLLFLHVVAAMLWVGGVAVVSVFGVFALRSSDETEVGRLLGNLRRVGPVALAPAAVALAALGLALVVDSDGWRFRQTWIWLGLALWAAAFAVGAAHQAPNALAAEKAAAAGDHAEARRRLRRWAWGMAVILGLALVATWDMVFKPGL